MPSPCLEPWLGEEMGGKVMGEEAMGEEAMGFN